MDSFPPANPPVTTEALAAAVGAIEAKPAENGRNDARETSSQAGTPHPNRRAEDYRWLHSVNFTLRVSERWAVALSIQSSSAKEMTVAILLFASCSAGMGSTVSAMAQEIPRMLRLFGLLTPQ